MQDEQAQGTHPYKESRADQVEKLPYFRPALRLYGEVRNMTQGSGDQGSEGASGMVMMTKPSDRKTKENIVLMGTHPLGIGLYLFDYKPEFRDVWGHDRMLGVMADEVEAVRPDAVIPHADGYKMVDYGKLN